MSSGQQTDEVIGIRRADASSRRALLGDGVGRGIGLHDAVVAFDVAVGQRDTRDRVDSFNISSQISQGPSADVATPRTGITPPGVLNANLTSISSTLAANNRVALAAKYPPRVFWNSWSKFFGIFKFDRRDDVHVDPA